jgi:hypothetical protein
LRKAACSLGLQLHVLNAEREINTAFDTLVELRAGALVVSVDPFSLGRVLIKALGLQQNDRICPKNSN